MTAPWRGRDGIALAIVLAGLAVLSVAATAALGDSRSEIALAASARDRAAAEALADAGIHRGLAMLRHPDPARRWAPDGEPHSLAWDGGTVEVSVRDEAGKVDLNGAPVELIAGLVSVVGEPVRADRVADAIADFRDADVLRRPGGAEDGDYRALGLSWEAKDAPFESVEELMLVAGIDRALYERLRPFVTVYTHQRGIDPRFAPREVLAAVPGLEDESADAMLSMRTADAAAAGAFAQLAMPGAYSVRSQSRVFSIRAAARSENGTAFTRSAVVRLVTTIDRAYAIHHWTAE
jgi:general secretion pathway protein K